MLRHPRRPLRWILFAALALAVGYAGVRFGRALRDRSAPPVADAPPFPFRPGDPFPDVALSDSVDAIVRSDSLLAGRGAVVLFLDPNCEGCTDMSIRWEHALAEGTIDPTRVFGVSRAGTGVNRSYRAAHRLSFPIYRDVEDAFLARYRVTSYPLEVVVGRSGTIRSLSDDSVSPVDVESVRASMSE
ncbi:MAG TPA: redoxin domain-containing protein [Candidatus Krumholzibacteria bacterium]|nr:redoxin domain-containing protein [Candidatus Krumholzibacteria bacterium]